MPESSMMLFSGTSHPKLSEEIAKSVRVQLGRSHINCFPDGEIGVQILENVRGRDVFVVQSIAKNPNFYLMELLRLIDALKRASARSIVAVIPYFGYARQDRKDKRRVPITAKLVANLLETAGATRLVTMDLHSEQIQGFFDIPVDNLYARSVFVEGIKKLGNKDLVVCAPDIGSVKLAKVFAKELGVSFAVVDKERVSERDVETSTLIGNVQGKDVILVDDICSTGETLRVASRVVKKAGAKNLYAAVTHPLFKEVVEGFTEFFTSNTIPLAHEIDHSQVSVFSVATLFGKAIERIVSNESVSSLFISENVASVDK